MRVEGVELRRIQIPFRRAFEHAAKARTTTDAVMVTVLDGEARRGWGEIVPRPYVTGETIDRVLDDLAPALAHELVGTSFEYADEAMQWLQEAAQRVGDNLATLAGFDLALLDLVGQRYGVPLADMLGGVQRDPLPAGVIIGFEIDTDKIGRYCATLKLAGKTHVKVKVGHDEDVLRVEAVAKVFKDTPLRLDANAVWHPEEAIHALAELRKVAPIASIEQPVAADDIEGLARVRESGIQVMADESVCSFANARALIEARAVDIFNIRLAKNGGLVASTAIAEEARRVGVGVHLGTMVGETGVLSAASEVFGRCVPGFECLDGKGQNTFLLEVDIVEKSGEHPVAPDGPGLGVLVDLGRVGAYQVGDTLEIARRHE